MLITSQRFDSHCVKKYHFKEKTKNVPPFITKQRTKIYNIFIKILQKYEHSHIFRFFGKKFICSLPLGVCYCFVSCICFGCKTKIFSLSEFFVWQKKAADRKNSEKKTENCKQQRMRWKKGALAKATCFSVICQKEFTAKIYSYLYVHVYPALAKILCRESIVVIETIFRNGKKNKAT